MADLISCVSGVGGAFIDGNSGQRTHLSPLLRSLSLGLPK